MKRQVNEAPHWFKESTGSGAGNGKKKPGDGAKKKRGEMNDDEKSKFIGEHGMEAYFALPA